MRVKSQGYLPTGEIKRKERLITKIMTRNYQQKLSTEIMRRNYDLVYYVAEKMWELQGYWRIQKQARHMTKNKSCR